MHLIRTTWLLAAIAYKSMANAAGTIYDPPAQNFTQKVDHASNDNATFLQRYQIDTTHFKPGGPILFHQSEELNMTPIADHFFSDYGPKTGGIVATLEHRYFGESFPYGLVGSDDPSTHLKEYASLTIENVLQDAIEFVNFIRKSVPGAQDSKVIYSGGSYGGLLAVMARVRHPETFYGSLAVSPALRSFGAANSLKDNPYLYAATDMVANIYWDADADATRKIRDALKELDTCGKDNSCATAIPDLNLCSQPANASEWSAFLLGVMSQYWAIPQFDYGASPPLYPPNSLAVLVNKTLQATTAAQVLRVPMLLGQPDATDTTCIPGSGASDLQSALIQAGLSLAFLYMICQFLPVSEFLVSPDNTLFPPTHPDFDVAPLLCPYVGQDWVTPDLRASNAVWEEKLNITDAVLDKTTRLIITHGTWDRTAAIGTPNLSRTTSDRNQSRVINVVGMAHVDAALSEARLPRGVRPQIDLLRDTQLAYIKEWVGVTSD